ncbi:hypothetical protein ACFSO7_02185 [Bacillus sp. CGMCC 1.16607]|uniref:hypothetical protein n=1 Tax=Bacillus sp. CGMCC 1.16607 TaxID=3351842 RepID=UPI0036390D1F
MKKNRKLVIGALLICVSLFSSMTAAYANEDVKLSISQWFNREVNAIVNNSVSNMESELNAEKERLLKQLNEDKQRAISEVEQYKAQELALYNQKIAEINSQLIEMPVEENEIVSTENGSVPFKNPSDEQDLGGTNMKDNEKQAGPTENTTVEMETENVESNPSAELENEESGQ